MQLQLDTKPASVSCISRKHDKKSSIALRKK